PQSFFGRDVEVLGDIADGIHHEGFSGCLTADDVACLGESGVVEALKEHVNLLAGTACDAGPRSEGYSRKILRLSEPGEPPWQGPAYPRGHVSRLGIRSRGPRDSAQPGSTPHPLILPVTDTISISYAVAFLAGLVSFLSPCVLPLDRKSTRLNSSHVKISYAVFCLKKKTKK